MHMFHRVIHKDCRNYPGFSSKILENNTRNLYSPPAEAMQKVT